jgi:very-short-patch-repair endonuclease
MAERTDGGVDRLVADLAGGQRGVVARRQLLSRGVGSRAIERRLRDGRLHRFVPPVDGAYLVGHAAPSAWARETAVLLVCGARGGAAEVLGGDVVLSHETALAAYGIGAPGPVVHVSVVGGRRLSRAGVRAHGVNALPARHVRNVRGLQVTSPARTLVDVSPRSTPFRLERLLDDARIARIVTDSELDDALRAAPGHRGTKALRQLLAAERGTGYSRSDAERDLLRIVRDAGLPLPRRNVPILGRRRDAVWDAERVVVEVDGWTYHWTPRRTAADDHRDAELHLAGWEGMRLSARTVRERPALVAARIAAALAVGAGAAG